MSNWYPHYTCASPSCQVQLDNTTGDFIRFVSKCPLHSGILFNGITDTELYRQVQIDSMRWAHVVDMLNNHTQLKTLNTMLAFNSADRSLVLLVSGASLSSTIILTILRAAIVGSPVLRQLLGGAIPDASLLNLAVQQVP